MPDFSLGISVTNGTEPFMDATVKWYGVGDPGVANLMKYSDKMLAAAQKAEKKGGPLTVVMTRNGQSAPAITGVTLDGMNDIEDLAHVIGGDLRKMGRDHAKTKKGHGKP
jgi:hypothetical protein